MGSARRLGSGRARRGDGLKLGENGEVVRRFGTATDIDARKQAEEALRRSEARFRAISEAAPLGIFLADAQGDCLYTNRAYLELTGRGAEEPLGDCWKEFVHPEERGRVLAEWYQAARARSPFEQTYRFVHRDGRTVWVSGKSAEIRVGDALTSYVGVVEDVTQERAAVEAIRRSEERFELAVRALVHQATRPLAFR